MFHNIIDSYQRAVIKHNKTNKLISKLSLYYENMDEKSYDILG